MNQKDHFQLTGDCQNAMVLFQTKNNRKKRKKNNLMPTAGPVLLVLQLNSIDSPQETRNGRKNIFVAGNNPEQDVAATKVSTKKSS